MHLVFALTLMHSWPFLSKFPVVLSTLPSCSSMLSALMGPWCRPSCGPSFVLLPFKTLRGCGVDKNQNGPDLLVVKQGFANSVCFSVTRSAARWPKSNLFMG